MMRIYANVALLNLFLAFLLLLNGAWIMLINFELAFFAALFIVLFSFKGYRRYVQKSLLKEEAFDDRDVIAKLEDPYDLYDDDEEKKLNEEETHKPAKKMTLQNTVRSAQGFLSVGRLFSYLFLFGAFVALQRNQMLDISTFLAGVTLGILSAIYTGVMLGKKNHL